MSLTQEQAKRYKAAIDCASNELNKLVVNEGTGNCALYVQEYLDISKLFEPVHEVVRDVARMFHVISTAKQISGFDANIYEARLQEVSKKLKAMQKFFRRPKIKCFAPKEHTQPCYCARLAAIQAAEAVALAPIEPEAQELAQAKIAGALILDRQLAVPVEVADEID